MVARQPGARLGIVPVDAEWLCPDPVAAEISCADVRGWRVRLPAARHDFADHAFWPDDISLLDEQIIDRTRILGPKQLTDIYLLALAVKHGGRLVTFDRTIPLAAVRGAQAHHLVAI
jgi:predicted nucleic acid-binding protein